jgi:hypothetical protein
LGLVVVVVVVALVVLGVLAGTVVVLAGAVVVVAGAGGGVGGGVTVVVTTGGLAAKGGRMARTSAVGLLRPPNTPRPTASEVPRVTSSKTAAPMGTDHLRAQWPCASFNEVTGQADELGGVVTVSSSAAFERVSFRVGGCLSLTTGPNWSPTKRKM